jgi:hypothetical protein
MRTATRLIASALLMAASFAVAAHPGGLDAKGCHNNRKTGEYHCHRAQTAPAPQKAVGEASSEGTVKMSKNGICHDSNSPWYEQTTNFTPYASMSACIRAGGRPPK